MKKAAVPSILVAVVLLALGVIAEAQQLWDGDRLRTVSEIGRRSRQRLSIQIMLTG